MTKQRQQAENLIYGFFDKLDLTKENSSYYKKMFSKMSDEQFKKYISNNFPYKLQIKPLESEPSMNDAKKALDFIKVPFLEKVNLNYYYINKEGKAVQSQEALVGYIPLKKMKQFITKKNSMSTDISSRDMKTGLLSGHDKNGITSDREFEALAINKLDKTIEELSKPRADSMLSKSQMYSEINTTGIVRLSDIETSSEDSLSKNIINIYLIGSHIYSNILNDEYLTPLTISNRKSKVDRD